MKSVLVGDSRFCVHDAGQGRPLLFVHGFPLSHAMWQAQLDHFAGRYRVIAPDLRGFGGSTVTPGTVTMQQMADDCAALLDALAVQQPVVFCGLSMGGYVGWQFVQRHAHRLSALVACDTRAAADTPQAAEARRAMAQQVLLRGNEVVVEAMLGKLTAPQPPHGNPPVLAALRRMILAAPPEGVAAAQRGMAQRPDVGPLLSSIQVPALVIVGACDAISPPEEMRSIAAGIAGARYVAIPGAGHMSPMEAPEAFNRALEQFLAQLD